MYKSPRPPDLLGHPTTWLNPSRPMSRVETRVTSVQVVPGFPACFAILNPPGWDPISPLQSSSAECSSPDASAHLSSCQQARDIEGRDDVWFSSTPNPVWPPDFPLPPPRVTDVETLPEPRAHEIGTPVDNSSMETASRGPPVVLPGFYVSWYSIPSRG